MYNVTVEDRKYQVEPGREGHQLDGSLLDWDLQPIRPGHYHLLYNNSSYRVEVLNIDADEKIVSLLINDVRYDFEVKDRFDALLEQMGMSAMASSKVSEIKAPMPGLVLDILVEPGTEVAKGDPLVVLEAMKMENILKSPAEGVVKAIRVEKGTAVEKNEVILNFE